MNGTGGKLTFVLDFCIVWVGCRTKGAQYVE
jgi:hypothetical protein